MFKTCQKISTFCRPYFIDKQRQLTVFTDKRPAIYFVLIITASLNAAARHQYLNDTASNKFISDKNVLVQVNGQTNSTFSEILLIISILLCNSILNF
jgi:hypothetical protein